MALRGHKSGLACFPNVLFPYKCVVMRQDSKFQIFFPGINDRPNESGEHWSIGIHRSFQNAYARSQAASNLVKPMPQIALMVVESNKPNAHASKADDGYTIMLNSALHALMSGLFRTMLAHPKTFQSIGDPSQENHPTEKGPKSLDDLVQNITRFGDRRPVDPVRLAFADHLTELTLRFVIEHEIAHILAGHLDYRPGLSKIHEIYDQAFAGEVESFGLEMHADEIAFLNCFYWTLDSISGKEEVLPKLVFIETVDAQVHDLYVATYALFQLFSHLSMSITHPNPLHRQIRLGMILNWVCVKLELSLINKPINLVGQALNLFNDYMEIVFQLNWSDRRQESDHILSCGMDDEIAPYSELVTSMYPALRPHSFLRLE